MYRINEEYGLGNYNALYIIEAILNLREIKRDQEEETIAVYEKRERIIALFDDWVYSDSDRCYEIEACYNKMFSKFGTLNYKGDDLKFADLSDDIQLYPYQKDAIKRIVSEKNTLLAFDVGSGKTYIMIAASMYMRKLGISRKNMFVVPNSIVGQWELIFKRMYPKAKLLTIEPRNFKQEMREKVLKYIKQNDYDGIIIAYSCFELIPLSEACITSNMNSELQLINERLTDLRWTPGIGKALEEQKKYIINSCKQLIEVMNKRPNNICFDDLEISTLFVDEAHNFKNIPIRTKLKNISGINKKGSIKCLEMQQKVRSIQESNVGRGVVFATGTPLCNSIADTYAMQMYLQPGMMKETNLDKFDNWVKTFAKPEMICEIDVDTSKFRYVNRLSRYYNLTELSKMFSMVAVFYAMDNKDGIPNLEKYDDVLIQKSAELSIYMTELCDRTEEIRSKKISRNYDNMLKVSTDGRKAALDLRLCNREQEYNRFSKIYNCVNNIKDIYDLYEGSAQIIFCDYSTPKSDTFNVYTDIKEHLIESGIPKKEIAFIHSYTTEEKKVELFEKINAGKVRVLIGSTFKLGIGSNVQKKLKAIHHLDVPWRPADMIQREGRILRKGNENKNVRIFRYITEGSFDAYSWQILENKQKFISQFLSNSSYQRSADDLEENVLTYAEVKALAISQPFMKELAEKQNELRKNQMLAKNYANTKVKNHEKQKLLEKKLKLYEKERMLTYDNKKYIEDNLEQLLDLCEKIDIWVEIWNEGNLIKGNIDSKIKEFNLSVSDKNSDRRVFIYLERLGVKYECEIGKFVQGNKKRLKNFFNNFSKVIAVYDKKINNVINECKKIVDVQGENNPYEKEIIRLKEEVAQLAKEIEMKAIQKSKI